MDKLREFLNSKTFFIIWAISTIPALIFQTSRNEVWMV